MLLLKLSIFAKKGTDEKVGWVVPKEKIGVAMSALGKKFGGKWVFIEELNFDECLKFNDKDVYGGFDNRDGSYCKNINKIDKKYLE